MSYLWALMEGVGVGGLYPSDMG